MARNARTALTLWRRALVLCHRGAAALSHTTSMRTVHHSTLAHAQQPSQLPRVGLSSVTGPRQLQALSIAPLQQLAWRARMCTTPEAVAESKVNSLVDRMGKIVPEPPSIPQTGSRRKKDRKEVAKVRQELAAKGVDEKAAPSPPTAQELAELKASCKELLPMVEKFGEGLNARALVDIVAPLRRAQKHVSREEFEEFAGPLLRATLRAVASPKGTMQDANLASWSMVLHGSAPMHEHAREEMQAVLRAAMEWFKDQGPQVWTVSSPMARMVKPVTVSMTLWAYATCGWQGNLQPLIAGVEAACRAHRMRSATPKEWANAMWACAKLGIHSKEMPDFWARGAPAIGADFRKERTTVQDVAMALYGVVKCGWEPGYRIFVATIGHVGMPLFKHSNPELNSTMFWALSQIYQTVDRHEEWYSKMCLIRDVLMFRMEETIKQLLDPKAPLQPLVTTMMALSAMDVVVPNVFTAAVYRQRMVMQKAKEQGKPLPLSSVIDSVSLALACGNSYPGIAMSIQYQLKNMADKDAVPDSFAKPVEAEYVSSPVSEGSTSAFEPVEPRKLAEPEKPNPQLLPEDNDDIDDDDPDENVIIPVDRFIQRLLEVRQWLYFARKLLADTDRSQVASWDSQTLSNALLAWALLLPEHLPSAPAAGPEDLQQVYLAAGADLFAEAARRAAAVVTPEDTEEQIRSKLSHVYTPAGFTQVYTAHLEAVERGLGGLPPDSPLLPQAHTAWKKFTQSVVRNQASNSQQSIAKYLERMGFEVLQEEPTQTRTQAPAQTQTQTEGGVAAKRRGRPKKTPEPTEPSAPPGTSAPLEPMLVDILLVKNPEGKPCHVAVEFDGPTHFLHVNKIRFYTGKSALRHAQLRRRVDELIVIPSRDWKRIAKKEKLGKKADKLMKEKAKAEAAKRQVRLLHSLVKQHMGALADDIKPVWWLGHYKMAAAERAEKGAQGGSGSGSGSGEEEDWGDVTVTDYPGPASQPQRSNADARSSQGRAGDRKEWSAVGRQAEEAQAAAGDRRGSGKELAWEARAGSRGDRSGDRDGGENRWQGRGKSRGRVARGAGDDRGRREARWRDDDVEDSGEYRRGEDRYGSRDRDDDGYRNRDRGDYGRDARDRDGHSRNARDRDGGSRARYEDDDRSPRRSPRDDRDEGYDRRGGGYDRRDGGYDRRDGGYGRRDGGYDRRDGGYDRRDGGRDGGYDRRREGEGGGYDSEDRRGPRSADDGRAGGRAYGRREWDDRAPRDEPSARRDERWRGSGSGARGRGGSAGTSEERGWHERGGRSSRGPSEQQE